jgi:hypothetical protein
MPLLPRIALSCALVSLLLALGLTLAEASQAGHLRPSTALALTVLAAFAVGRAWQAYLARLAIKTAAARVVVALGRWRATRKRGSGGGVGSSP